VQKQEDRERKQTTKDSQQRLATKISAMTTRQLTGFRDEADDDGEVHIAASPKPTPVDKVNAELDQESDDEGEERKEDVLRNAFAMPAGDEKDEKVLDSSDEEDEKVYRHRQYPTILAQTCSRGKRCAIQKRRAR
jgi:hypothetical protein